MKTRKNNDALFVAISTNNLEKLKSALTMDVDLQDARFGDYPLTMAAKHKRWKFTRLIAEHPNKKNQNDLNVALFLAVKANKVRAASSLLKAGADANFMFYSSKRYYDTWTPIYEALDNNNHQMVGLLLYYGACLEVKAVSYSQSCNVLEFASKIGRNQCLELGWEEYDKLKAPGELVEREKEITVIIAQGLRQRESYIVKLPIEIVSNILDLAGNKFHKNVLNIYNKLNYISFNFIHNKYHPKLFSNYHSKALVAKISDGIKQDPVNFYALFQLIEKYLNKYLNDKNLTLDQASNKSSLIRLLKEYHIADSPEISLGKKSLSYRCI